jgi:hypothetical protein
VPKTVVALEHHPEVAEKLVGVVDVQRSRGHGDHAVKHRHEMPIQS